MITVSKMIIYANLLNVEYITRAMCSTYPLKTFSAKIDQSTCSLLT